jgi:WD40 repeat protein
MALAGLWILMGIKLSYGNQRNNVIMRNKEHNNFFLVLTLIVLSLLISCRTNDLGRPISTGAGNETTFTQVKETLAIPIASQTAVYPTGTMEPTLAYWATAQQGRFNAESTQVAETQQAISALSAQYSQMCGYQLYGVSISPDGNWIATDCRFDGDFFRVFQTHGNQVWDVPYSVVMKYYPEFIGSVRALHWSPDGKTLYFTSSSCCADTDVITNGDALYRFNLQTGDWDLVIDGVFSYYSFSPDNESLLYILNTKADKNNSVRLHLLELRTGNVDLIDVDGFEQAGWAVWKQDGQKIGLIAQTGSLYSDDREIALMVVDLQKLKSQTVIPLTEDGLTIEDWSNGDILTIRRSNVRKYHDFHVNIFDVMIYDLKNTSFITPTPIH